MEYQTSSRNIGIMSGLTWSVKFLLIANVAVFALEHLFGMPLSNIFKLPGNWYRQPTEFTKLFTYMFIHGSLMHLVSNMIGLFFIGPVVERRLGSYRFFILYYVSGIIGGLGWSLLADPYSVEILGQRFIEYPSCVGASGAIMGILGAFASLYPNAKILLWFVIPMRAWVLAILLAIWELSEMVGHEKIGGIANAAHLIGGIAGFCYAYSLAHPHVIRELRGRFNKKGAPVSSARPRRDTLSKEEIDHILDKIGKQGMGALTPRERELLKRATR